MPITTSQSPVEPLMSLVFCEGASIAHAAITVGQSGYALAAPAASPACTARRRRTDTFTLGRAAPLLRAQLVTTAMASCRSSTVSGCSNKYLITGYIGLRIFDFSMAACPEIFAASVDCPAGRTPCEPNGRCCRRDNLRYSDMRYHN